MIIARTDIRNIFHNLQWVTDILNLLLVFITKNSNTQAYALSPSIQVAIFIQRQIELVSINNLNNTLSAIVFPKLNRCYFMGIGTNCLRMTDSVE